MEQVRMSGGEVGESDCIGRGLGRFIGGGRRIEPDDHPARAVLVRQEGRVAGNDANFNLHPLQGSRGEEHAVPAICFAGPQGAVSAAENALVIRRPNLGAAVFEHAVAVESFQPGKITRDEQGFLRGWRPFGLATATAKQEDGSNHSGNGNGHAKGSASGPSPVGCRSGHGSVSV